MNHPDLPPVGVPRRATVAADRDHRDRERTRIVHAAATVVATHGYGAATMTRVQHETGLARDQLYRPFLRRTQLLTEVYRRGHHRAAAPCIPCSPREHVDTFTRAAIEQAKSDPVVAAMHALKVTPIAAASSLPNIYRIWGTGSPSLSTPGLLISGLAPAPRSKTKWLKLTGTCGRRTPFVDMQHRWRSGGRL